MFIFRYDVISALLRRANVNKTMVVGTIVLESMSMCMSIVNVSTPISDSVSCGKGKRSGRGSQVVVDLILVV